MNTIINPINNKAYNINEPIGRDLLKQYVKNYSSGGMMRSIHYESPDCKTKLSKLSIEYQKIKRENKFLKSMSKDCHIPLHHLLEKYMSRDDEPLHKMVGIRSSDSDSSDSSYSSDYSSDSEY